MSSLRHSKYLVRGIIRAPVHKQALDERQIARQKTSIPYIRTPYGDITKYSTPYSGGWLKRAESYSIAAVVIF